MSNYKIPTYEERLDALGRLIDTYVNIWQKSLDPDIRNYFATKADQHIVRYLAYLDILAKRKGKT